MVMRSIQRQSEYVTLFAEVDTERLALLKKANSGTLTDKQIEKLQELIEIAEIIVVAIEENGVLNGN